MAGQYRHKTAGKGLQCGHGHRAVENDLTDDAESVFSDGFNAATAIEPWRIVNAVTRSGQKMGLQCGHGHRAVENPRHDPLLDGPTEGFNAATAIEPWRIARVVSPWFSRDKRAFRERPRLPALSRLLRGATVLRNLFGPEHLGSASGPIAERTSDLLNCQRTSDDGQRAVPVHRLRTRPRMRANDALFRVEK